MVTDVELSRALNALAVTLNDQKAERLEPARCQQIVTGALGGQSELEVRADDRSGGFAGWLEEEGRPVAELRLEGGRWITERKRAPRDTRAYVPGD